MARYRITRRLSSSELSLFHLAKGAVGSSASTERPATKCPSTSFPPPLVTSQVYRKFLIFFRETSAVSSVKGIRGCPTYSWRFLRRTVLYVPCAIMDVLCTRGMHNGTLRYLCDKAFLLSVSLQHESKAITRVMKHLQMLYIFYFMRCENEGCEQAKCA